jgi:predicted nucleic acid-binding Zn ribbon protein
MAEPELADISVFSERLTTALAAMVKGEAPNVGRFCGHCYTPLDPERRHCPHCGRPVEERPPVERVPSEVLEMFRQSRRRESLVVNSFAYLGLALGVLTFIAVFYLLFTLDASVWWFVFDIALLFVLSRVLAGLLGGVVGDEMGFRYARRKLTEEWREYEVARSQQSSAL